MRILQTVVSGIPVLGLRTRMQKRSFRPLAFSILRVTLPGYGVGVRRRGQSLPGKGPSNSDPWAPPLGSHHEPATARIPEMSCGRSVDCKLYACMHACIHACMCQCVYLSMYVCMYACMYLSIYLSICLSIHLSMYACIYLSIYLSIYTCIHMQRHTDTHTHIYIYTYICSCVIP